jgi:hypothetical protein
LSSDKEANMLAKVTECAAGSRWTPAERRYLPRMAIAMGFYMAALYAALHVLRHQTVSDPLRYALAIAPAIPILGAITVMGLYLKEEADEFKRAIVIEAMLWGLGVTLVVTTIWGFLENLAGAPGFDLYLVFPLFCTAMGLAAPFVRRRYT